MDEAVVENHIDWIENSLKPLLDENLRVIILNVLAHAPGGQYFNKTMVITRTADYLSPKFSYHKVFLPGIEQHHTVSGKDNRLVVGGRFGRAGFTTCYDYLFHELLRKYAFSADSVLSKDDS